MQQSLTTGFKHGMKLSKRESRYLLPSGLDELGVCAKQVVGPPPLVDTQPCRASGSCSEGLMGHSDMEGSPIWSDMEGCKNSIVK